jgi:hypothetical protein
MDQNRFPEPFMDDYSTINPASKLYHLDEVSLSMMRANTQDE